MAKNRGIIPEKIPATVSGAELRDWGNYPIPLWNYIIIFQDYHDALLFSHLEAHSEDENPDYDTKDLSQNFETFPEFSESNSFYCIILSTL